MATHPVLTFGDYAPWFKGAVLGGNPEFGFDTVAGRAVLLLFFGSAKAPHSRAALDLVKAKRNLFDDVDACFFGVTVDPEDGAGTTVKPSLPGIRHFLDMDGQISRMFNALDEQGGYRPHWVLLDRDLRLVGRWRLQDGEEALAAVAATGIAPKSDWAPVALIPNIFEPVLCERLIQAYEQGQPEDSGFMREVDGQTVHLLDSSHKQRRDLLIEDADLRRALMNRLNRRLLPGVKRAFQFEATRIERHIVACYEAGRGHFRAHRDNTTAGTAHRRFAVTINLNAEAYEGGDLHFPEYGPRTYRAPTGGAIVFSCALLHEARPVEQGRRFCYLPFLYDDEGARLRAANRHLVAAPKGHNSP